MLDSRGSGLDLSDEAKLNLYETIGYLVGMPDVPVATQVRPAIALRRQNLLALVTTCNARLFLFRLRALFETALVVFYSQT